MKPLDRYHIWGYQLQTLKKGKPLSLYCTLFLSFFGIAATTALSRIFAEPKETWGEIVYFSAIATFFLLAIGSLVLFFTTKSGVDTEYKEITNIEAEDEDPLENHTSVEGEQDTSAAGPGGRGGAKTARRSTSEEEEKA